MTDRACVRALGRVSATALVVTVVLSGHAGATTSGSVKAAFGALGYRGTASSDVAAYGCDACHIKAPPTSKGDFVDQPLFGDVFKDPTADRGQATYQILIRDLVDAAYAPRFGGTTARRSISKNSGVLTPVTGGSLPLSPGKCATKRCVKGGSSTPVLTISDPDPADSFNPVDVFSISATGAISLRADRPFANRFGSVVFDVSAASPEGLVHSSAASRTIRVTVDLGNTPPVIVSPYPNARADGTAATINLAARDADGDDVTFSNLVNVTGRGTAGAMTAGGQFSYTPPPGITGSFEEKMQVTIDDGSGGKVVAFSITADGGTNTPPKADDAELKVTEDTPISGTLPASDTDPIKFSPLGKTALAHGSITVKADGSYSYSPDTDEFGEDTFVYTATDSFGATDQGTLKFRIESVPDKPVTKAVELTVNQTTGNPATLSRNLADPAFVTDVDSPAGDLRFAFIGTDNDRAGTVEISESGALTYTTRADWAGSFKLFYSVTDNPLDPSHLVSGSISVNVTLNGRGGHDQPGGASVAEVAGSLTTRYPSNFPPGSATPQSCHSCHQPRRVTEKAPDCTTTYFTAYGAALCLVDPFDPDFGKRLAKVAPQFEPSYTPANAGVLLEVLETDTGAAPFARLAFSPGHDLDGRVSRIVDARLASVSPTNVADFFKLDKSGDLSAAGDLTRISENIVTLQPQPVNFANVKDRAGQPDPAFPAGFFPVKGGGPTVSIRIIRQAPVVADDIYQTNVSRKRFIMNVADNDTGGGPVDRIEIVTNPTRGTASIEGTTIVFVSNGTEGDDSLVYRAFRNGAGASATNATVSLRIFGADAAVAQPDSYKMAVNETLRMNVLANDRGKKNVVSLAIVPGKEPKLGTAKVVGDAIVYKAGDKAGDEKEFEYQVTGRDGTTTRARIFVHIGGINGGVLARLTSDPELKPVARAMGNTCRTIDLSSVARTDNQKDLLDICNDLADPKNTKGSIDPALDQVRNEEVLVAGDTIQQQDRATNSNLLGRLDAVRRGGGRGFNLDQVALQIDGNTLSGSTVQAMIEKASDDDPAALKADLPWGVFVAGTLSVATQDSDAREAGFDLGGLMLTVGADYQLNDRALLGLAGSFGQSIVDIGGGSALTSRTAQIAGYGSFELLDGLSIDGYGGLAFNSFDMDRRIAFGLISRTASSSFDGEALSAALRLKYSTEFGGASLDTYATLNYLLAWTDAYVETGAGGLNLAVGEQNFDTLTATVGFRLSDSYEFEFGMLKPYIGASYARQLLTDDRSVRSRFGAGGAGAPGFLVSTTSDGENFGSVELGLAAEFADSSTAQLDVSGTFSDGNFQGYMFKAGMTFPLGPTPPSVAESDPVDVPTPVKRKAKPQAPPPGAESPGSGPGTGGGSSSGGGGWGN